MFTKKKKIIVLVSMVALLVLTGFLNLTLNKQTISTTSTENTVMAQSFFESYRMDRNSSREQQVLYYQAVLESENSTEDAKKEAEKSLSSLAAKQEQELVLEGYILAKGFNDAVVSFTDNYVNVMVKSSELNDAQVAQIVEVVQEQTAKSIDNIKIIPVE